jgi:hypothetical protein
MTHAIEGEKASAESDLASKLEIIDLKKANGLEPTPEVLAVVKQLRLRISELGSQLEDRAKATTQADVALKVEAT